MSVRLFFSIRAGASYLLKSSGYSGIEMKIVWFWEWMKSRKGIGKDLYPHPPLIKSHITLAFEMRPSQTDYVRVMSTISP